MSEPSAINCCHAFGNLRDCPREARRVWMHDGRGDHGTARSRRRRESRAGSSVRLKASRCSSD
eukprot:1916093-Prymnesium_polylepis.1